MGQILWFFDFIKKFLSSLKVLFFEEDDKIERLGIWRDEGIINLLVGKVKTDNFYLI